MNFFEKPSFKKFLNATPFISAILFDLDDTLLVDEALSYEVLEEVAQQAEKKFGVNPKLLVRDVAAIAQELWRSGECYPFCRAIGISAFECLWGKFSGTSQELTILREWSRHYRQEVFLKALLAQCSELPLREISAQSLVEEFSLLRRQRQRLFPEARAVLEQLSQHYRLGLLTNGAPDLQREKIAATGCEHLFSAVAISGEYGIGKPEPAIFEHLLRQLNAKPEEAMMVGNSLERDIAGANDAGVMSVWIRLPGEKEDPFIVPDMTIRGLEELSKVFENFDSSLTR